MRAAPIVVLGLLMLAACGDPSARDPSTTAAPTTASPTTVAAPTTTAAVIGTRHFTHDQLAAALPIPAQLGWLPADTATDSDYDLTSSLGTRDCAGANGLVHSNEGAATNRSYRSPSTTGRSENASLAQVTYYDIDDVAAATGYIEMIRGFVACPPPSTPQVTFEVLTPSLVTRCADSFVVLEHQPVGETIDGWCRVGNLIAWFKLYSAGPISSVSGLPMPGSSSPPTSAPAPLVPPTAAQADQTLAAIGDRLVALMTG
jgi:hypothetical protein